MGLDPILSEWGSKPKDPASKYKMLKNDTKPGVNQPVYRIIALRDIPEHKVRTGDLGGYITSESNLTHEGAAWVADEAVVIGRARVEGNALAKDHSIISDYTILGQDAVVGGFTIAKDHAVIRGNARIRGASSIEDQILIEGNVDLRQTLTLSGHDTYDQQDQLPWSFRGASPSDPEYVDRLHEAAEIDPAIQRAFSVLGAHTTDERSDAINELWNSPEGRKAISEIASNIGGTFTPDDYFPRTAAELASDHGVKINFDTLSENITGYSFLVSLRAEEGYEQHSGERIYAGVVQVNLGTTDADNNTTLYQPALYQESDPEFPTLTPLPGRTFIGAETYTSRLDADARAQEYLAAAITPEQHRTLPPPKEPKFGQMVTHNTPSIPFVQDTNVKRFESHPQFKELITATVQNVAPSTSNLAHDLGRMSEPQGYAVLEMRSAPDSVIDLSEIQRQTQMQFHRTPEKAHLMADAIYAGRDDFTARMTVAIDQREERIGQLKQLFSVAETAYLSNDADIAERYQEHQSLDPLNTPVLVKVLDTPAGLLETSQEPRNRAEQVEQVRSQLQELNWRNSPNTLGMVGVGNHFDNMFEASSLNLKFIVDQQGDEPSNDWSLYVQKPDAKINSYDWNRPIHREDNFETADSAMDAAETYRAEMIADEMTPPNQHLPQNVELDENQVAAIYRERTHEGTSYIAATIETLDVGYKASLSDNRFEDFGAAAHEASEMLQNPAHPQRSTGARPAPTSKQAPGPNA